MLVANGYADNFDLESLLKLQRKLEIKLLGRTNARSSSSRDLDIAKLIPKSMNTPIMGGNWLSPTDADALSMEEIRKLKKKRRLHFEALIKGRITKSLASRLADISVTTEATEEVTEQLKTRSLQSNDTVTLGIPIQATTPMPMETAPLPIPINTAQEPIKTAQEPCQWYENNDYNDDYNSVSCSQKRSFICEHPKKDFVPPDRINDLSATLYEHDHLVHLTFTASGDDGVTGRSSKYEIRTAATQQGFTAMRENFSLGTTVPADYFIKGSLFRF